MNNKPFTILICCLSQTRAAKRFVFTRELIAPDARLCLPVKESAGSRGRGKEQLTHVLRPAGHNPEERTRIS